MKAKPSKVLYLDAFWKPMYVGFVPTKKAWDAEMRRLHQDMRDPKTAYPVGEDSTSNATTTFLSNREGGRVVLVTIEDDPKRSGQETIGLIVHEVLHIFRYLCDKIGEEKPSEEFEAYTIQALTNALIVAYEETRGKLFL